MSDADDHAYEGLARLLRERRTVHDFTDDIPPRELIEQAIDVARWAPNHLRTEPWHFYLLDRDVGNAIAKLNSRFVRKKKGDKAAEVKLRRWTSMPGWLVVTCARSDEDLREREDYAACCCAVHNMSLYLWEQGVGMKWTTGKVTRDKRFNELVGIDPDSEFVVGMFWYGYPATIPVQHRKPVGSILTHVSAEPVSS